MLGIIYGTNSKENINTAYKNIENIVSQGKCAWILVPEQFSLSAERFVIKHFGVSAQKNIKVITFSRLCNLVLSQLGPLRLKYIDDAGRQIVAAAAVRKTIKDMNTLSSSVKRRGFSTELADLVSEFKRYGVSPQQLSETADICDREELSAKLKDISRMYEVFNSIMEEKSADAEDNLSIICPKLKNFNFDSGCLFIMHFRSFTPIEHKVIGEVMHKLDICAVMCCDDLYKPSDLFSPVVNTCRLLMETAERNGIEVEEPIRISDIQTSEDKKDLYFLRRNFFAPYLNTYKDIPENISVYEVSNNYREAEAAADLILKLCRKEGRHFSDFLILARNTDQYIRILPSVFEERGINIFLDNRCSITSKPFAEMLCASFDILAYGYSYERIMAIANSGLTSATDEEIDVFENYILAADPSHAMWANPVWEYEIPEFDLNAVNKTRQKVCAFTDKLSNCLSGRKTAAEICTAVLKCLKEENTERKVLNICSVLSEKNDVYTAEEYRRVWNGIISVLSQLSTLMDDEQITWRDFSDLFKNACNGIKVGISPQTQDSVTFAGIDKFRTDSPPVVIVLGMTDGVFPAPHTSEGLISDSERIKLEDTGITLAPGALEKCREEQQFIYSVLTAPKDKLYFFVPLLDTDGAVLYPSSVILKCRSIFPNLNTYNPDTDGDVLNDAEGATSIFHTLCNDISKTNGNPNILNGTSRELYDIYSKDSVFSDRLNKIINASKPNINEKLSRKNVKAIYGEQLALSATKLEKYNDCAFSYFLRYGLIANERSTGKLDSRDTGSIQHEALYLYFSELKDNNVDYSDITYNDCSRRIKQLVEESAKKSSEILYESSFYFKYIINRMQGIVTRTAWETIKFYRSAAFRPYGYEIKIDTDGDIPALEIKDNDGTTFARLRGFIDRADTAVIDGKSYVSIIDYKSSKTELDPELSDAGVKLQPLLYSDVICRRLNANPAAMLYMRMNDPIIKASELKSDDISDLERTISKAVDIDGWINDDSIIISNYSGGENGENFLPSKKNFMSEEELKERIDKANEKIREAAENIYNGEISANPFICKSHNACTYCPYTLSCSKNKI